MDADIPTNYDIDIPTITTAEVRTAEELGINDCNNIDIDLNEREISVVLDDVNVHRYAEYLKKFSEKTQFLIITHRKGTMEAAKTMYGVTMEEHGISKLLSIRL